MFDLANLGVVLRPMSAWSNRATDGRRSPFKATLGDTAMLLGAELRHLKAERPIVLELAIRESDIRNDGLPRADARCSHPGVVLSFQCRHGWLRLATDACSTWEHNLRAIAMHLEHLRLAGLYGVGRGGEQYAGWKALPPGTPAPGSVQTTAMTPQEAAIALSRFSGFLAVEILKTPEIFVSAFRLAAKATHPDAVGGSSGGAGSADDFQLVSAAKEILEKHHAPR